jgi:hypothetical protein
MGREVSTLQKVSLIDCLGLMVHDQECSEACSKAG